jgi:putative SOS response-associated peptidase YedK
MIKATQRETGIKYLADGFYEWRRTKYGKVPYHMALKTEEPFAFAGIWSRVHDAAGRPQTTFVITTVVIEGGLYKPS